MKIKDLIKKLKKYDGEDEWEEMKKTYPRGIILFP